MDRGRERRIVSIVVFSLIGIATVISSVYVYLRDEDVKGVETEVKEESKYPYISNLMPKEVYVGEEYIFIPRISSDGDAVVIVQEGPSWMRVDEENIVRGTPSLEDIGAFKVVLRVENSLGSSTITDYIIVLENEE